MSKLLEIFNYKRKTTHILDAGSTVMIDASIYMFALYHRFVSKYSIDEIAEYLKCVNDPSITDVVCDDLISDMEALVCHNSNTSIFLEIRSNIIGAFVNTLCKYVQSKVTPILVWDMWINKNQRTPGKINRKKVPMLLRRIDMFFIYISLKYMGFHTIVSNNDEAEKFASVANIIGKVDAIVSTDTDCIALGAFIVAGSAGFRRGNGVKLTNVYIQDDIITAMSTYLEKDVSKQDYKQYMVNAAIFLGCDFCQRIYGNGPSKFAKHLKAGTHHNKLENISDDDFKKSKTTKEKYLEAKKKTLEFFNITDEYLKFVTDTIDAELATKKSPNKDKLMILGIYELLSSYICLVENGALISTIDDYDFDYGFGGVSQLLEIEMY